MAEWDNHAQELTVLFALDRFFWNTLNKTEQQQLVLMHASEGAKNYGEVTKLKGYKIADQIELAEWSVAQDDSLPASDVVVIHSELWVIPNKEQKAILDG